MYAAPAVLSSLIVIPFALRMRKLFPQGLTYSEYFIERFDKRAHLAVITVILYTMVLGGVIQLYVGGAVIGGLTGIDPTIVTVILMIIIGAYILLGGLWGSMTTDLAQFISAIILTLVFVPFLVMQAGGPDIVYQQAVQNLGGKAGPFFRMNNLSAIQDLFLPYALGLGVWGVVSLATWQRTLAIRRDKNKPILDRWWNWCFHHNRNVWRHRDRWARLFPERLTREFISQNPLTPSILGNHCLHPRHTHGSWFVDRFISCSDCKSHCT